MTKRTATKRSLVLSFLSLLLCFSMLIGTTYAWFTDSVTSNNNIIKSGNLDVELEYAKVVNGQITGWETVQGEDEIFDPNALWEPGRVEVVYLKVSNLGNLALKYQLGVNVVSETTGTNVAGDEFKLSDSLVFKAVLMNDTLETYTDREAVAEAAGTEKGLKGYNGTTKPLAPANENSTEDEDYVALIVYMPETVGNEANYRGTDVPTILLGINLYATQQTAEEDSFDENYDKGAWVEGFKVYDANELQAAIDAGKTYITLENDIETDTAITVPASSKTITINMNGKKLSNPSGYAFENQGNLVIDGNGTVSGLGGIRSKAGSVTIESGNFFASSRWQDSKYQHTLKAENSTVVINGGNFDATKDGHTNAMLNASQNATITINGGTFKNVEGALTSFDPYIFTYEKNGKVIINDGTFYGGWRFNGETATTDIYGGTFTVGFDGQSFNASSTHVVTVYGGTFTSGTKLAGKLGDIMAVGYKAVEITNGLLVCPSDRDYVQNGVFVSTDEKTYFIANADGFAWMADQADAFFAGKTVKLDADIDFGGKTINETRFWNPENRTYFDGQGKTLSNFVITNNSGTAGLFAGTFDIKNLNVDNANVTGRYAGVISGNMYGNIDNCTVKDSTVNNSYWQGGALVGQYNSGNVTNCTVENCKISGGAAIGGLIGILNETTGERKIENCAVKNCEINMTNGFGGNWDKMFGVAVGYVNTENSTIILNCTLENNKLNGEASDLLFGVANESNTITINSNPYVTTADELKAAVAAGATKVYLADGEYDLNGNQKDGLKLVGVGDNVKVANTTKYASGKATGAIWKAIHLENVTITDTVYTMADGGNATFTNVTFEKGFRQGYGKNVVFTNCSFGSNTEGYALHFQTDSASEGGEIKLTGCEFEGGKVHLGGKRAYAFTGCDFAAGTDFQVWSNITLENCTVDGEKVTADNMNTLFPKLDATKVTLK